MSQAQSAAQPLPDRGEVSAEIQALQNQYDAVEEDARRLVSGLDDALGSWRERDDSWSVTECLDHLATGNRVYLEAMQKAAIKARERGKLRRKPALPGLIGGLFIKQLEPPVNPAFKMKSPRIICPRQSPPLQGTFAEFIESHQQMAAFLRQNADLDLAGISFVNPFIRVIRFSLATGLQVIPAHERRHLWQAWRVRQNAERSRTGRVAGRA